MTLEPLSWLQLRLERVDDFKKRKLVKIGIAGANLTDSILAHEDRGVRVVEEITAQMRKLRYELFGDLSMSLRRDEHAEAGRSKKGGDEAPRLWRVPWVAHYPRMSG